MQLIDSVIDYLGTPHTGALMISGPWGCGKTFFIKNTLLDKIKEVNDPECGKDKEKDIKKNILETFTVDVSHFYPVVVSVFGINNVHELESLIVRNWLDSFSNGFYNKLRKATNSVSKIWKASDKLTKLIDFSKLIDYHPGLSLLPSNTVIIIDDLERLSENIDLNEMLGFINNLIESRKLKVIIVANEDYLKQIQDNYEDHKEVFKEKVVEKTLRFQPNIKSIFESMVKECAREDDNFVSFMLEKNRINSILSIIPLNIEKKKTVLGICNLRTLKFAINHFYVTYKSILAFAGNLPENITIEELYDYCWHYIVALSIEMKENYIDITNTRNLENYNYFKDGFSHLDLDEFHDSVDDEDKDKEKYKVSDSQYCQKFHDHYLCQVKNRHYPISSPEMVKYIIEGNKIDYNNLIQNYSEQKAKITGRDNESDRIINQIGNLRHMDNREAAECIEELYNIVNKGEFSSINSFITAANYLNIFHNLIGHTISDIILKLKEGIDYWFERRQKLNHDISTILSFQKNHFYIEMEEVGDYISDKIKLANTRAQENSKQQFIQEFTHNICDALSPMLPEYNGYGYSVTKAMETPLLSFIPEEIIREKILNITPAESTVLVEVFKFRYNHDFARNLRMEEKDFWKTVFQVIHEEDNFGMVGRTLTKHSLEKLLGDFLEKLNNENNNAILS